MMHGWQSESTDGRKMVEALGLSLSLFIYIMFLLSLTGSMYIIYVVRGSRNKRLLVVCFGLLYL